MSPTITTLDEIDLEISVAVRRTGQARNGLPALPIR